MMWAATPLASAASCGEVLNDWPTTDTLGARSFLLHHFADDPRPLLAVAGQHHGKRIDEGEPHPLKGERRQSRRVEADDEIRDGVAEPFDLGYFHFSFHFGFCFLGERRLS